ncbi:helix-turn-helix domain-containing protein [Streptomyces sp. NPDC004435]|uniref:helix-turn-helix domain-containing protein n=1 Tax=Streptomyces sp. NPDC004435 TaxID=3364701 RepID=UPI00367C8760
MPRDDHSDDLPPFAPVRAVGQRESLGLTLGQVAWAVTAYRGESVHPDTVAAWESGAVVPDGSQVKALAAALWCSPVQLVGEPTTLAQCRVVAGLDIGQVAREVGVTHDRWQRIERLDRWQGDAAQTAALLRTLRPPPAVFVAACGTTGRLRVALREAVTTWSPHHVVAVARIVPMPQSVIAQALERLHLVHQRLDHPAGGSQYDLAQAERRSAEFLDHIDRYLWHLVRQTPESSGREPSGH